MNTLRILTNGEIDVTIVHTMLGIINSKHVRLTMYIPVMDMVPHGRNILDTCVIPREWLTNDGTNLSMDGFTLIDTLFRRNAVEGAEVDIEKI